MAKITASFEGNGGGLVVSYSSNTDVFKKRNYGGLELRNMVVGLEGKTNSEIVDDESYSLRSTAVAGKLFQK